MAALALPVFDLPGSPVEAGYAHGQRLRSLDGMAAGARVPARRVAAFLYADIAQPSEPAASAGAWAKVPAVF